MDKFFEMNSVDSKLEYIKVSAPSVFKRVQSELEKGNALTDFKNRLLISKAVFEAFELSGMNAIATTDSLYDVPAILHYLTKEKAAHIDGKYKVVDNACFAHCPSLETIVFEEGVEGIHERVLCDNLLIKGIRFPKTLKYIRDNAFRNCKNLSEIVFLNPKTWVSPESFEGTRWFAQFTEEFVVVNGQLIKYNGNEENVIIPEGVVHISHGVFKGKENIKTVVCPTTLENIWTYSFAGCTNLQNITFNDNLKMICISAFEGCINLKEVSFPKGLEELGATAFRRSTIIRFYNTNQGLTEHIKETYPNCIIVD